MKIVLVFSIFFFALCDSIPNNSLSDQNHQPSIQKEKTSKIIFSRSSGGINTGSTIDVLIYDPTTEKTKLLVKGTVKGRGEYGATTSPDNSKIILHTYQFGGWKLGIGDFVNGLVTNVKRLTDRKNYEYCGKFSPDGLKTVYQEYNWATDDVDIFIADQNGKNAIPFFKPKLSGDNLDWTKDSKAIIFTSANDEKLKICLKSVDGKVFQEISKHNANDFAPSTSKVADKVAFLSDRTGKINLFVMNLDGSNPQNLTPDLKSSDADGNDLWAYRTSWSPDGEQIVFNAMINGNLELFVVNSDGSNLKQITNNSDTDMTPFWMN